MVMSAGQAILRHLRREPEGATMAELCRIARPADPVSSPTVRRALNWLQDYQDAPVRYDGRTRRWLLDDADFSLPLSDPTPDDFVAAIFAQALLAPLGDADLNQRVRRLVEEMDARLRADQNRAGQMPRPSAVMATLTTGTPVAPEILSTLVRATGKGVVRIEYTSPWFDCRRTHTIEPWQLRVHDGALYLRGYSRAARGPRNYRVAQIQSVVEMPGEKPRAQIPSEERHWAHADAFGIDEHRPGTAVIRVRGPVARWLAHGVWHEAQEDRWIEEGDLLERRVPYRSCRELARRLLSLGDGLEFISPADLREEVKKHAQGLARAARRKRAPAG